MLAQILWDKHLWEALSCTCAHQPHRRAIFLVKQCDRCCRGIVANTFTASTVMATAGACTDTMPSEGITKLYRDPSERVTRTHTLYQSRARSMPVTIDKVTTCKLFVNITQASALCFAGSVSLGRPSATHHRPVYSGCSKLLARASGR